MDEYTFKRCPNGHYYQGNECPYCKAQAMPSGTNNTYKRDYDMKGCPNGHAYDKRLYCCPYCGEKKVVMGVTVTSALPSELSIELRYKIHIKIDEKLIEASNLDIFRSWHIGGVEYRIVNIPFFDFKSKIEIGDIQCTGKELYKWIEFMMCVKEFSWLQR